MQQQPPQEQPPPSINQEDLFFTSGTIRKRKVYYSVPFTTEQKQTVNDIKTRLKKQQYTHIPEDPVLLRFWYGSDLQMETCLAKLKTHQEWFHNPQIQSMTLEGQLVLRNGFIYSYAKTKQHQPFVIMNLGQIDLENFTITHHYQALNKVHSQVAQEQFLPGHIQTYAYILDFANQFLSLPLTSFGSIIKTISEVYCMQLQSLKVINCTTATKWLYNRTHHLLEKQTDNKIQLFTQEQIEAGVLREWIDEDLLQKKYGGNMENVTHNLVDLDQIRQTFLKELEQSEYYSVQENEEFFSKQEPGACCGNEMCAIY